jgi:hypothetical protein
MPIHADTTLLQMALIGYEAEREKIQAKIDELKARLGGRRGPASTQVAPTPVPQKRGRRQMSAAARKRIALAQRKRWAEYRRQKAA